MNSLLTTVFLSLFFVCPATRTTLPWPFSFATVPTLAFPGALPRFFTPLEVANFVANFSSMNIWGLNVLCAGPNATPTPATCPPGASSCHCGATVPPPFYTNQEAALAAQAAILKAAAAPAFFPVLGYIRASYLQLDFEAQAEVALEAQYASWWLAPAGLGRAIDCFVDKCSIQGTEYRILDLGRADARAYSAQVIVGRMLNNTLLDGIYLDSLQDVWAWDCERSGCSPAQVAAQYNGSLAHLDAVMGVAAAVGKVVSSSTHYFGQGSAAAVAYYESYLTIVRAYPSSAVRFWEFWDPSDVAAFSAVQRETALGVASQVHVGERRTLAPDWVELAAFLIVAGNYTWFSCSGPWNVDSFTVYPEFSQRWGEPHAPASRANGTAEAPWALLSGVNLAAGLPPSRNASVPGVLGYLGNFDTPEECRSAVTRNASFLAMTHIGKGGGEWDGGCWGRLDAQDWPSCVNAPIPAPQCYTALGQTFANSALSVAFTRYSSAAWLRSFEHADVMFDQEKYAATITWR